MGARRPRRRTGPSRAWLAEASAAGRRTRSRSIRRPASPSRAGTRVSALTAPTATPIAAATPRVPRKPIPEAYRPEHGDDHGDRGDQHGPAAGGDGPARRLGRVGAVDDLLPVAGGQEQRVVDADTEAHHHGQRGRDARERERRGGHPEHPERGGHAEHRGEDGQARGEHAAEPEQQHHDGHHDADQLGSAVLGLGPGRLAERAAVADRDPRRPRRGHRLVHLGDVAGAERGRVLAEVDHVVGGPAVAGRGAGRQRVARGQHVRQGPDVRDRALDRAAVAGQGARADREHQLAAQPARLWLVLAQQQRAGLGRRVGSEKLSV